MTEHDDILDGICDSMDREPKKWQINGNYASFYKDGDNGLSYRGPDVSLSLYNHKSLVDVTKPCQISSEVLSPQAMKDVIWEFENLKKHKFQELVLRLSDRFPPRSEPGERTEVAAAVARLMRDSAKWQGNGEWFSFYENPQDTNSANLALKVFEWTESKWFSKKIKKSVVLTFKDPDFPNVNGGSIELPLCDEDKDFLYAEAQVLKKALVLRKLGATRLPSGL
jgi:hypothetical protein